MYDYETSEKLFIDIWEKYGKQNKIEDTQIILRVLSDLIEQSN